MKDIQKIAGISFALFLAASTGLHAQGGYEITGKILSPMNQPVEGAVVSVKSMKQITTKADGTFSLKLDADPSTSTLSVWAPGYLPITQVLNGRKDVTILLIPDDTYKYNEEAVLPFRADAQNNATDFTSAVNIAKKDFLLGSSKIDKALMGQVAGLQVKRFGGMPGDGSYINLRGIRTLTGDNAPLIVINGVPYMPDKTSSPLIDGLSRDIFQAYNINDIQNITVLKGAEAAMYGSMGSNGVILIETDGASANDMQTRISYYGSYGTTWNDKRMPLLSGKDYNEYLTDVGMTRYSNMNDLYNTFPFLNDPNNPRWVNLYNNNTDWQNEVYKKGFNTEHLFRVEGGDNIAKYDLALGYATENGLYQNTSLNRYHTQLNANVLVSKKIDIFATVGFAYLNGSYMVQGMDSNLNPILAAYAKSPVLSPYAKDRSGNLLTTYAPYNETSFGGSNPVAIVNDFDAHNRQYDLNLQAGLNYTPFAGLTLTGLVGLYYNYDNEALFVPATSEKTIVVSSPKWGTSQNLTRAGVAEAMNFFWNVNARYSKTFNNLHQLNALAGAQVLMTKKEFDAGEGRTDNDYYKTLGNAKSDTERKFFGYIDKWNWMNYYAHADYTFDNMLRAGLNMSVDAASSTGVDANRFYLYPSASLVWMAKEWKPLQNTLWLNRLNVRAEYSLTGNSRYANTLGNYYYTTQPFMEISGITRLNIPNTTLKPEKNASLNVGIDVSALQNRLSFSLDYYDNHISDMLCAVPTSSLYGTSLYYMNVGKMTNRGVEFSVMAVPVRLRNFEWSIGGNIATYRDKVTSLGGRDKIASGNLVTEVGKAPYQFYGYQAIGVFSTQAEADAAHLMADNGSYFRGGDMHYVDQNGDGKIDSDDKVALGSAAPKFFGSFYSQVKYKGFALSAEFSYSKGNKAYNAVRRQLESMNSLGNQSTAVLNRWMMDGQVTDIPRPQYNDTYRSTSFSSRWIEDASYVRLRNLTFSFTFDQVVFDFFRGGTLYVTAENLWTGTKYLGLDPEVSYSYGETSQGLDYAKMVQPKSIKFGVNLKF